MGANDTLYFLKEKGHYYKPPQIISIPSMTPSMTSAATMNAVEESKKVTSHQHHPLEIWNSSVFQITGLIAHEHV